MRRGVAYSNTNVPNFGQSCSLNRIKVLDDFPLRQCIGVCRGLFQSAEQLAFLIAPKDIPPKSQTHTAAAVDCHLRWSTVRWLFIHASILVPHVDRTRDVATVESAHRAGVRRAERVEVRRQPWASDCARTKDWTRITAELRSAERRMEKRRDDAEVCCGAGPECLPAKKS